MFKLRTLLLLSGVLVVMAIVPSLARKGGNLRTAEALAALWISSHRAPEPSRIVSHTFPGSSIVRGTRPEPFRSTTPTLEFASGPRAKTLG